MYQNIKKEIKIFANKLANEAKETKEAAKIVAKYSRGEELTDEEEEALKEQFYDVLKMTGIGVPFALIPGASVILPLLIAFAKKKNINILPSSFNEEDKNSEEK
jgi:TctA family transporter